MFRTLILNQTPKAMQAIVTPTLVEKEIIGSLSFKDRTPVKQHPDLMTQILDATRLGNAFRSKVSIFFTDDEGPKRVNTTVWASGTKYICLKGGIWIPISRISEIKS